MAAAELTHSQLKAKGEAVLSAHASFFTADESKIIALMRDSDQSHVFGYWSAPDVAADAAKKHAFLTELVRLNGVAPLADYVKRAKALLRDSKEGVNPYESYVPHVPIGESLETATPAGAAKFDKFEAAGVVNEAKATAFVLVAGGLGERLDYPGIKVALPSEITTGTCYLHMYIKHILALQTRARAASKDNALKLPLVIMTSGDTDAATRKLLNENKYFGMDEDQLTIVTQEKVPALSDNEAHFAVAPSDPYVLNTKPHGHGDVHTLLYTHGLVQKWSDSGRKWIVFFQDTNGLVFRAIPAALGVSAELKMAVNSLTVPRKPGEAVGAIMRLEKKASSGQGLTINVEYNQLESLVKKEDTDAAGYSVYPGNINVLILGIPTYLEVLKKTSGIISEFINPKYKDATKTTFKKDTRLECMMQDYPKLLEGTASVVGFTQFERWLAFSPVKNSLAEAKAKQAAKLAAESASSGEADMYYVNRKILASRCFVSVDVTGPSAEYAGISVDAGARIVWSPEWATTQAEARSKIQAAGADSKNGTQVTISARSTLVLNGAAITIKRLHLDGALVINAVPGAHVTVDIPEKIHNSGWQFTAPPAGTDPKYAIRGYVLTKPENGYAEFNYASAGEFLITAPHTPHKK